MSDPIRLPVVGPRQEGTSADLEGDEDRRGAASPEADLVAAGWERRFVATGERLAEVVSLYRRLGFQVRTELVREQELDAGCAPCFAGKLVYHAIYTRRPGGDREGR